MSEQNEKIYKQLWNVYRAYDFDSSNAVETAKIENEAFSKAIEKLDFDERLNIKMYIERLSSPTLRIKNLGQRGAIEAIAKVGIFLALNNVENVVRDVPSRSTEQNQNQNKFTVRSR